MSKFGFRCESRTESGQPILFCQAWDENPIGGEIIRVRLLLDKTGNVREGRVQEDSEWFDNEACMLPRAEESASRTAGKVALFPVRLATRHTLFGMTLLLWSMTGGVVA